MKIVSFYASNIKRLKAVEITPTGNVVEITGRNSAGKSSVLDSIWFALAGTKSHPSKVIRDGEESAVIKLDLGELVVRRTFDVKKAEKDGELNTLVTTRVFVETPEGAKFPGPQEMLNDLIDSVAFDPLAFARMSAAKQYETLKRMTGVDVETKEEDIDKVYNERREQNRIARDALAAAEAIHVPEGTPEQEVSLSALIERLNEAQDFNEGIMLERGRRSNRRSQQQQLVSEIEVFHVEILKLQERIAAKEDMLKELESEMKAEEPLKELIDIPSIQAQMRDAEGINAAVRKVHEKNGHRQRAKDAETEAARLTDRMKELKDEISAEIEGADMPVPGLMLSNGQVMFKEEGCEPHPFEVLSDALQLRISCAIVMRGNSKLRVIRIRDGSLLDDDSMNILREMAADKDYQVWVERVDSSGEIGVVIEGGEVVNKMKVSES